MDVGSGAELIIISSLGQMQRLTTPAPYVWFTYSTLRANACSSPLEGRDDKPPPFSFLFKSRVV